VVGESSAGAGGGYAKGAQGVQIGDGNVQNNVFGPQIPDLDLLLDRQLPTAAADGGGLSPAELLRAETGVVPFHGRGEELRRLVEWCEQDTPFSLHLVTGEGGVGKTRLALELVADRGRAGWVAGFFRGDDQWAPIVGDHSGGRSGLLFEALKRVAEPVLVVVDYGEDHGPRQWNLVARPVRTAQGQWPVQAHS
jgi:hypothetical protein